MREKKGGEGDNQNVWKKYKKKDEQVAGHHTVLNDRASSLRDVGEVEKKPLKNSLSEEPGESELKKGLEKCVF